MWSVPLRLWVRPRPSCDAIQWTLFIPPDVSRKAGSTANFGGPPPLSTSPFFFSLGPRFGRHNLLFHSNVRVRFSCFAGGLPARSFLFFTHPKNHGLFPNPGGCPPESFNLILLPHLRILDVSLSFCTASVSLVEPCMTSLCP